MDIRVIPTKLAGVLIIEPEFVHDERGFFAESYHKRRYAEHGIDCEFVQDNHARSHAGVLRGIHYQDMRAPMAKLVRCTYGRVWDVAVDLRVGSPTFGQWAGAELSAQNMRQMFLPIGFGHAYLTLSDAAEFQYKCTNYYAPETEAVLQWNDEDLAITWPFDEVTLPGKAACARATLPILSRRDERGVSLRDYLVRPAFTYDPHRRLHQARISKSDARPSTGSGRVER